MSKVFSTIKRRNTSGLDVSVNSDDHSPEAVAARSVKSFCESSGPNSADDEVIYLPPIVEAAESSPSAAKQCADMLREYLKKDYVTRPDIQYNALMLVRILADNPGPTFTRNLDQEFAKALKDLLKNARGEKVRQMLMETLTSFETTKFYDDGLTPVIEMWKKEKEKAQKSSSGAPIQSYLHRKQQQQLQQPPPPLQAGQMMTAPPLDRHSQNYFARTHRSRRLPEPVELAGRLEEARTSAKLLQQVVTNTPPGEIIGNDLIKEFAERCQSASRSIQGYMASDDPTPDNETMESLIDTNEQLQSALNLHQRAMLNARKHVESLANNNTDLLLLDERPSLTNESDNGLSRRPSPPETGLGISLSSGSGSKQPVAPQRETNGKGKAREYEPLSYAGSSAGPSRSRTPTEDDPFRDPEEPTGSSAARGGSSRYLDQVPRLDFEPFHPGMSKDTTHGAVENLSAGRTNDVAAAPRRADSSDNDSLYDVSPPKQKEPIYRY
ncbi:putative gat domain-containing protein [Rosellinia necatrix]|uniref:Putative gat domain-containing protein n=1 Tax=Rosellinia necatrix TaxID=77044 RepID=A0A1W2TNI1_ROSNE|nr:putative gat domain-containing protein [Rosellinia necatrix]